MKATVGTSIYSSKETGVRRNDLLCNITYTGKIFVMGGGISLFTLKDKSILQEDGFNRILIVCCFMYFPGSPENEFLLIYFYFYLVSSAFRKAFETEGYTYFIYRTLRQYKFVNASFLLNAKAKTKAE